MYNKINNDENISSLQSNESYDYGTATFGIAKGNIQSVLTLVMRDPGEGVGVTTILLTGMYH
jgi:hypothetical protein